MASRNHQLLRLHRLRFELGRELGPVKEARRTAAEVTGLSAAPLVVQRQAEELRQETERAARREHAASWPANREG
jgi:hypothetical protein